MKISKIITIIIGLTFLVLYSCQESEGIIIAEHIDTEKGDTLTNDYAKAFRIIEYSSKHVIEVLSPYNDFEVLESYIISKKENSSYNSFQPNKISSIIPLSSTHIGMLNKLKAKDLIIGVSAKNLLCSPLPNSVAEVGELGNSDLELLVSLRPDVIIYSGFNRDMPILKKLRDSNIKTFMNYEWQETHPLGRAEWIKVLGLLIGKEQIALEQFQKVKSNYESLLAFSKEFNEKPTVMAGTPYGDIFHAPAGNSYLAQLINDAGGDYVYNSTEGTASISKTYEQIISENKSTQFWLNPAAKDKLGVLNLHSSFGKLNAFTDNMYSYFHDVNCFWENSAIEPDRLLSDLISIFHSSSSKSKLKLHYYRLLE